ncbi:transient receptor potential channel pyrexia-like [Hyposmocoma kahamanoa]|uniref:transient receptor potential channel pyrexia-like n=1 Tax=Hyposmocoma kahamanoa TaxID=1477025 RepID=UPI000E6D66CA|nr:transient receptor potential channel pyrexia-like [Hyposmocoma kahamanoa]
MLLEAGGQFNTMKAEGINNVNTPLHTAVELDSQDTITELLNSGASITCLNEAGQTPLHVCILNKLEESLKMLVNYVDPLPKTIDVKNSDNRTILDVAVTEAWMPGVCIALKAGADITLKANNNETLLHVAAKIGNMCILKEIVSATEQGNNQNLYKAIYHELLVPTKENVLHVAAENGHTEILNYLLQCTSSFINNINGKGETALIKATINGHLDCVKLLLTNGADIKITTKEKVNVFHVAAENGHLEILKYLLEQKLKEEELLLNTLTESKNGSFGPIHFAVSNNHGDCVKLLLKKGADVNLSTGKHGPYSLWTPLHIAVYKNNIDVAEILLQNEQIRINEENEEYWSPLHLALHLDVRDILPLLLRNGADLSSAIPFDPVKGKIALHFMLRKNSPESVDFMEEIFDSCISTNTGNDPNCEITLDYRILTSTRESNQVNVLQELLNTNNTYVQKKLLAHPLVESFIYLKWKALLPFSCTIIAMYVLFVISMTILAGSHSYHDVTERPIWLNPLIWTSIILCSLYFMYAQVAISHFTNPHREILFREIPIVRLVIFLLVPILMYNFVVTPHMSAGKDFLVELLRDVTAFALPLSYVALMMLCSKFMKWGYYIHMYSIVAFNVLKIFLIFAYLIFTFAISFMIQFNGQEPFENLWTAFLKTIVMMTSEFDYDDAFVQKKFSHIFFLTISRIFFVMFVIFIVIVLMNIMIGVAVNDINDLKALGNIRRIVDEADFLSDLDVEINTIIKILPRKVNSFVRNRCKVQTTLKLNPGNPEYQQNNLLPSHLRDAILHKTLTPKERR